MALQDVGPASRGRDIERRQRLEDAVDVAVPARGLFERDRPLGQPELQRAVAMIPRSGARQCAGR